MKQTKKGIMNGIEDVAKSRVVAPNTVEYFKRDGTRVIRLHNTDILIFTPDGKITLNSSGWYTQTTKSRLNTFLPPNLRITQQKGLWYLHFNNQSYLFKDGMQILKNNKIIGAENLIELKKLRNEKNKLKNTSMDT